MPDNGLCVTNGIVFDTVNNYIKESTKPVKSNEFTYTIGSVIHCDAEDPKSIFLKLGNEIEDKLSKQVRFAIITEETRNLENRRIAVTSSMF